MINSTEIDNVLIRIMHSIANSMTEEQKAKLIKLSNDSRELISHLGGQNMVLNVSFECLTAAMNIAVEQAILTKEQSDKIKDIYAETVSDVSGKLGSMSNFKKH